MRTVWRKVVWTNFCWCKRCRRKTSIQWVASSVKLYQSEDWIKTLIQEIYFAKASKVCNEFWYIYLYEKKLDVVDESIGTFGVIRFDSTSWANIFNMTPRMFRQNQRHINWNKQHENHLEKSTGAFFLWFTSSPTKTSLNLGNLTSESVYIPQKKAGWGKQFLESGLCVGWTIFCRDLPDNLESSYRARWIFRRKVEEGLMT